MIEVFPKSESGRIYKKASWFYQKFHLMNDEFGMKQAGKLGKSWQILNKLANLKEGGKFGKTGKTQNYENIGSQHREEEKHYKLHF